MQTKNTYPGFFRSGNIPLSTKKLQEPIIIEEVLSRYTLSPDDPLYKNLTLACKVANQVRSYLHTSSTHPEANNYSFLLQLYVSLKLHTVRRINNLACFFFLIFSNIQNYEYINHKVTIFLSKITGVGNCFEYSLLAKETIKNISPSTKAALFYIVNGDHTILVQDSGNTTAVVCDAWLGEVFLASEVNRLMNFKREKIGDSYHNALVPLESNQGWAPFTYDKDYITKLSKIIDNVRRLLLSILFFIVYFLMIKTLDLFNVTDENSMKYASGC